MSTAKLTWQSLVDTEIVGLGNATQAMIYQIDNKMLLASTPGCYLPPADFAQCIDAFEFPEAYMINNITFFKGTPAEMTFLVAKADARSVFCKRGKTHCFFGRSKNLLFVLFGEPPVLPGRVANCLEILIDYCERYNS